MSRLSSGRTIRREEELLLLGGFLSSKPPPRVARSFDIDLEYALLKFVGGIFYYNFTNY